MTKWSHNAVEREISDPKEDPKHFNSTFDLETTARDALRQLSCPKEWSAAIHVSPQQVNSWKNGAKIPGQRQRQIVHQAMINFLFLDDLREKVWRLILKDIQQPGRQSM